ncbi:hypothetical protein [Streptomyces violaceusniger]|uniref:hypothetical protein n=1 Tax=Streptomyces violaceusniger TaxID=68280 RepID=UPI00381F6977
MERSPLLPRTALALATSAARADSDAYADRSVTTDGRRVASYKRTGLRTTYLLTRNLKAYKLQQEGAR